jgi:gamma-glutamylcyclotransferase (GGCT)/AIG2-like uncharacterized protein YtfP
MPQSSPRHVFVYGTLRKGEERDINRLQPTPRWIGRASVAGVIHHLGSYPGLTLTGPGTVQGEVYAVTPELEQVLDEIEQVWPQQTGEYAKREVLVQLEPRSEPGQPAEARELMCFLYEISPEHIEGKPLITLGDWVLHRTGGGN